MITYKETRKGMSIFINRKKVGTILQVKDGYHYFPLHSKHGGKIFATIVEVIHSLESK